MSWKDILIAVKKGIVASKDDLANYFKNTGGYVGGDVICYTNDTSVRTLSVANSLRTIINRVYANGDYQLYDNTNKKTIISSTANGATNTFNGTASGNLPNKGGVLTTDDNAVPLILNRGNSAGGWVLTEYKVNNVVQGRLGFYGVNNPVFVSDSGGASSLLHTGNSAKVAIQSSAPTDTSALWVY